MQEGNTTYVEYEYAHTYDYRKLTEVSGKGIGKFAGEDRTFMQPNVKVLKFFPDTQNPKTRNRNDRSYAMKIGTWIVIRKIAKEYHLREI